MRVSVSKSVLAFALTATLLAGAALRFRHRRSAAAGLLVLATVCFLVVALTHVFESLAIMPAAGWGQPHSVGHYLDLTAALLGIAATVGAVLATLLRRRPT